ncbi:SH3 domain-containing protein [Aliisedimentitalea scapharcae]|uniref:SH3 domain-containing protein n=1 Tax=Aliisedimentitalea scapharcae TaxID=1524259 RepID=A0ABZ2XU62_9RHOB
MSRFVVVSFAFLGWAFYELSGGADFQPPERPDQLAKQDVTQRLGVIERVAATAVTKPKPVLAKRVTRSFPMPQEQTTQQVALTEEAAAARRDVLSRGLAGGFELFPVQAASTGLSVASLADGTAQLVSISQPAPAAEEQVPYADPEPDLREVTGTRVNMRNGPGTTYPVIERLSLGNAVEVLDDSGTGWLRLRSVQGQNIGWIAASLISKKSQ